MAILRLAEADQERLAAMPETGMGFQVLQARIQSEEPREFTATSQPLLVLNSEFVIPFREVEGVVSVPRLQELGELGGLPEEVTSVRLDDVGKPFDDRPSMLMHLAEWYPWPFAGPPFRPWGTPLHTTSQPHQAFCRFSAFHPDRRVLKDGSFTNGTYATTWNDSQMAPSGLAAVGRYALPNPLPAIHMYIVVPQPGTPIIRLPSCRTSVKLEAVWRSCSPLGHRDTPPRPILFPLPDPIAP